MSSFWELSTQNKGLNPLKYKWKHKNTITYPADSFSVLSFFFNLFLKLRYRDIVAIFRKGWMEEQGSSL